MELDAAVPKGSNASGIELPTLCEMVARKLAVREPDELVRRAFRAFDVHSKGYISPADLQEAVDDVAPHMPQRTVALAFSQLDSDRDGRVSYRDFHEMMCVRPAGCRALPHSTANGSSSSSSVDVFATRISGARTPNMMHAL